MSDKKSLVMALLALILTHCGGAPEVERAAGERVAGVPARAPSVWFRAQRSNTDGRVPPDVRSAALRVAREEGALRDAPGTWVNEGPINVGGRVTAIAVDPNDPDRIWIGAADGGIFLTEDEGQSWTPVFDDQVTLSIGALVADPVDSDVVWVGTGEDNGGGFSYDGEGVFKTIDGGTTWTQMGLAETRRIAKMVVDPTDGDRIWVAAGGDWFNRDVHRGVYRSTDGGQNWSQVLFVADDAGANDIIIDPLDPDRIYASIWERFSEGDTWKIGGPNSGIWRTLDGGDSWTKLTAGLPSTAGRIGLALAPSLPQHVYANVINTGGTSDGIYLSADGGDTWAEKNNSPAFSGFSYYFSQIRVDPLNRKLVYALDQRLWRSFNSALDLATMAAGVHVDWHDLVVEPGGRMLAGTDGGFYVSQDSGTSWTKSLTLPITQFYDLGIDTLDPNRRFAGAQDNGTNRTTDGGQANWVNVLGGDGLQCEVDYTDSNKVYASSQWGNLARSVNGGDSFLGATSGIGNERTNWNAPLVLDPVVPSTLYTGTYRVYRSIDSAQSWSPISPDLTGGSLEDHDHAHLPEQHTLDVGAAHLQNLIGATVTVVNVSPVDTDILWAGTDDGNVWVSDDAGQSWSQVNPAGPAYWVSDIGPDPFDAQTAYLTVSGYRQGDKLPYVRKTTDLGVSWVDISGNLPQVPVSSILADTDWPGRLFVGTDLGVYVSDDGGLGWEVMRGGMPWVVVMDLVRHDPSDTLWAGTHGRSIYSFALAQLGDADGDGDGADNNVDCLLDDGGVFAPPGEVANLTIDRGPLDEALLAWDSLAASAGSDTRYRVVRGSVAELPTLGTAAALSLDCDVAPDSYTDSDALAEGEAVYYLVGSRNVCGDGGWGFDSAATPRIVSACP